MDINNLINYLATAGIDLGLKILGAIFVLIVGRWIIRIVIRLIRAALERQWSEPTLTRYVGSLISILLNLALVIAILGFFGFETTTFAALLAGVGVAIGAAWSGLLANFAAGLFLVVLRPFKVGDAITAGGLTGTVKDVGMFFTKIDTPDNVISYVGNNKIFSDNIQNYTDTPYRRVDSKVQLEAEADPLDFIQKLRAQLAKIPNVLNEPVPEIGIIEITREGTIVAVRPFAQNKFYSQVQFDTNRLIVELLKATKTEKKTPDASI